MKTLHSLTSRGRIRVFFESANAPKGASERQDGGKNSVLAGTQEALASVMLATALVLGNNGNAQAQTADSTQIAAATVAPGEECNKIPDRMARIDCKRNVSVILSQRLAEIENKRLTLEQVRDQQQKRIAELKAKGFQITQKSWEDVVPRLQALEKGDPASGIKGIGISGVAGLLLASLEEKFDEFMRSVIEGRMVNWEYAVMLREAAAQIKPQ